MEEKILELLSNEDHHLSFLKGILPSIKDFSEDEFLIFQSKVISNIQEIKRDRQIRHPQTADTHNNPSTLPHYHTLLNVPPNRVPHVSYSESSIFNNNSLTPWPLTHMRSGSSWSSSAASELSEASTTFDVDFSTHQ